MATQSTSRSIDLQKVISGAAELELKALLAGVECWQVWLGQAARLSSIANDTLQAIQKDKGSLSDTARRLSEFGKQNAEVYGALSSRLSKTYYDELGRLASAVGTAVERRKPSKPAPKDSGTATKGRARKRGRRRGARAKA
jgi:hypothetical protein